MKVAEELSAQGIPVRTFDNPLRSVSGDAASLTAFLATIDGPIVLVGHSYGGVGHQQRPRPRCDGRCLRLRVRARRG
ncbi:hypothetical protein [Nocardia salmonicida]|uniref:hypothetical protein n=1 Tax=Nocardia salmonicida TaxID=53431 RepID=UPI002E2E57F9|nr:hypothetical protein [Nocardia salmonicida]